MKKDYIMYRRPESIDLSILLMIVFLFLSQLISASTEFDPVETNGFQIKSDNLQQLTFGKVTDAKGVPIPGVSVLLKGTTISSTTNIEGDFSIEAPENGVLIFSFIGFATQEVSINNKTQINVKLVEDVSQLNEVIVVGYGTQKKSDLTGTVTRANIDDFRNQPNTSIAQSLQGTVAGLNIGSATSAGSNPSITIRGRNTLQSGNSNPLIVLDGVIYRGNLIDINPADVASVDVLKDASSTAIYGSQAANGVLIITSKSGKKSRKPVFNFSNSYSVDSPAHRLTPLDRKGFIENISKIFYQKAYLAPDYTQPNPAFNESGNFAYQSILDGYNNGTDTNWLDLVTQTAYTQDVNLSMAGSGDKTSYFFSAGYTDQKGYVRNDNYNRLTLRSNFDNDITKWLTVGMQSFMTSSDYSGVEASLRGGYIYSPLISPYKADGSLFPFPLGIELNPLNNLEIDQSDKRFNLFGNFYANIKLPLKGLSYRINHAVNYSNKKDYSYDPIFNNLAGRAVKDISYVLSKTTDNILTYKNTFGEKHSFDATFLYGFEKLEGEGTIAESGSFLNASLGYNSLESGATLTQKVFSSAWDESSIYQMGRFNYKFNNKYLLTLTARRDGFSGFGSNKKFGTFPSAAAAWVLSNEKFIANNLPWVNNLKARVSYGKSGNRTIGRYGTLANVTSDFLYVFGPSGAPAYGQFINKLANNNLGWESTTGLGLGLDFSFLNSRITGSVDYYDTNTEDILFQINIPSITGFDSVLDNIGKVANKGIEISLSSVNIKSNDFTWESTFAFSKNDNKIVSIVGRDDNKDGIEDDLIANGLFIGKSIESINSYEISDKLYQLGDAIPAIYKPGNRIFIDQNGDGLISPSNDRKILGRREPAFRFSVYNEFRYKNFTLSAFINSIQGGKDGYLYETNPKSGAEFFVWGQDNIPTYNIVKEYDAWTPLNPNAKHPGLNDDDPDNTSQFKDRSFVRLQDVRIAYNLPKSLLQKLSLDNLTLYVTGKNLHTWTKWEGTDPEILDLDKNGDGKRDYTGAFDLNQVPVMKSFALGMNLTF